MAATSFIVQCLYTAISIYLALLFIRVLLTWFPTVDWSNPLFSTLSQLTDPYLNLFRRLIPPLGMIDISPMLAFLLLGFVQQLLGQFAGSSALSMAW